MTESYGAPVYIHVLDVPAKILVDGASLRGESLVGLDQLEIVGRPAGCFERHATGRDRPGAHDCRIDAGRRPGNDAGERPPPAAREAGGGGGPPPRFSASGAVINTTAAAPSLMPEALPAVTVPFLSKAGRSLARTSTVVPCLGYSSISTIVSPRRVAILTGT